MEDGTRVLGIVIANNPELGDEITERFKADEAFKELCLDLANCYRSIEKIELKKHRDSEAKREFVNLSEDLESELISLIVNGKS